jgi:heat shock protein HslJ
MNKFLLPFFSILVLFLGCKSEPVGGDLENTYWQLSSLKEGNRLVAQPEGNTTTLIFATEELSGQGVCNRYFADIVAEGTSLTLEGLGSTRMACEGMDFENIYFQTLREAHGYSVLKNKLIIFSENGQLTFSAMSDEEVEAHKFSSGVGRLVGQFQPLDAGKTPHLYPIVRVDNPGNYPYTGTLLDTSLYKYFDQQSSEIWNSTGGDVLAVGKFDDFYICRVPGRYVSSDIALFRLHEGRLKRSETVAWAWCDEGWCNQQDAWLKDANADGRIDLIQHYTLTDDRGKIREERTSVMLQSEDGTFKEDKSIKIDKSKFPMARI